MRSLRCAYCGRCLRRLDALENWQMAFCATISTRSLHHKLRKPEHQSLIIWPAVRTKSG